MKRGAAARQRGAAVIEFVPLFVLLLSLFYATFSYGLIMLVQQALTYTASEGARAAVKVEPAAYTSVAAYQLAARNVVRTQADKDLGWMSDKLRSKILSSITVNWNATGAMEVRVRYEGYAKDPLLPALALPGVGTVPPLPDELVASATLRPN